MRTTRVDLGHAQRGGLTRVGPLQDAGADRLGEIVRRAVLVRQVEDFKRAVEVLGIQSRLGLVGVERGVRTTRVDLGHAQRGGLTSISNNFQTVSLDCQNIVIDRFWTVGLQ